MIFRKWSFYVALAVFMVILALLWKIYHAVPGSNLLDELTPKPTEESVPAAPQLPVPSAEKPTQPTVVISKDGTITASGIIETSVDNIAISAPFHGVVADVFVQVGDRVGKNQPLFKLDDRTLQGKLGVQEANVRLAIQKAEQLRDQLKTLKTLKYSKAMVGEDLKVRERDLSIALAQVEVAKAEVDKTKLLLDRVTVRAPKSGWILDSAVNPGQYVSEDLTAPAMILGDIEKLQIRVYVNEQVASRLKLDSDVVAYPKNNPSQSMPIHFLRIDPVVKTKAGEERVLQVIYTFEKPRAAPLYVGQQMDVIIKESSQ